MATHTDKWQAHELVEQLESNRLVAVVRLLKVMIDPMARSITDAPIEEEEICSETAAELDAAHASIVLGEGVPHQEILRQFGAKQR